MTVNAAISAQIVAPSARWSVWVHSASLVRTCAPPTTTWITYRTAAQTREPDERRVVPLGPPGDDRDRDDDEPDERRDPAMQDVRRGQVGDRRERASRPSAASPGR